MGMTGPAAAITGGADIASGLIQGLFQYYGMKQQMAQADRINTQNLAIDARNFGLTAASTRAQMAMAKKAQKLNEEQFAYKKEQDAEAAKWQKTVDFMNRFTSAMNANPQAKQRLIALQQQRRA